MNILKQFIGADQVDDTKILLRNAQYLRARNAANSANINLLRVNASDIIEFASLPQYSGSPFATQAYVGTQLGSYILSSEKGANNGVATLDGTGKVPVGQLPNSVMEYQGAWDASTNSPTLADGTGNAGDVYLVSVAGTQDLGSGPIAFAVNDFVIYSGTVWQKSGGSGANVSLSNLTSPTAINQDLSPATDLGESLGTAAKRWAVLFVDQIIDGSGNLVNDVTNRVLYDTTGVQKAIDYTARQAFDSGNVLSIDWQAHQLFDNSAVKAMDWQSKQLFAPDGSVSVDFGAFTLTDDNSLPALTWGDGDHMWIYSNSGAGHGKTLRFSDTNNTTWFGLRAADSSSNTDYIWPAADAAGSLTSDGAGNLSWVPAGTGNLNQDLSNLTAPTKANQDITSEIADAIKVNYGAQEPSTGISTAFGATNSKVAVQFTVGGLTEINAIEAWIAGPSRTGTLQAHIYSDNAGVPNNPIVSSQTVDASTIPYGTAPTIFTISSSINSSPASFSAGTYWIVLEALAPLSGDVTLFQSTSQPAPGNTFKYNGSWSDDGQPGMAVNASQFSTHNFGTLAAPWNKLFVENISSSVWGPYSGPLNIFTPDNANGTQTGAITIKSGTSTTNGTSGFISLLTGDGGQSEGITLQTGTTSGHGTAAPSGTITLQTGQTDQGTSGSIQLITGGIDSGNQNVGGIAMQVGTVIDGTSNGISLSAGESSGTGNAGNLQMSAGNATGTGTPGFVSINAGYAPNGIVGGAINIQAGAGTTAKGGSVLIYGGDTSSGGETGDVILKPGQVTGGGGTVGFIKFQSSTATVGYVWTATNADGSGDWAPAAGSGANTTLSNLVATTAVNVDLLPAGDEGINLGAASNRWANAWIGGLVDSSSVTQISLDSRQLNASDASISMDWGMRELRASDGSTTMVQWVDQAVGVQIGRHLLPVVDDSADLGIATSNRWRNLYLSTAANAQSFNVVVNGASQASLTSGTTSPGGLTGASLYGNFGVNTSLFSRDVNLIAETFDLTLNGGSAFVTGGAGFYVQFWTLTPSPALYYIWVNTGTESDPTPGGTGFQVSIAPTDGSPAVAAAVVSALGTLVTAGYITASAVSNVVTITMVNAGAVTPPVVDPAAITPNAIALTALTEGQNPISGGVSLESGNASTGAAASLSGDVLIRTGAVDMGGTRGKINLVSRYIYLLGDPADAGFEEVRVGVNGGYASETGIAYRSTDATAGNVSGALNFYTGDGSAAGSASGSIGIFTSAGDVSSGGISLSVGSPNVNGNANQILIQGGNATGTGNGSPINIQAGQAADGAAGGITIQGGNVSGTGSTGDILIAGGNANNTGTAGNLSITSSGLGSNGSGAVTIRSGLNQIAGLASGAVDIRSGDASSNGNSGQVTIGTGNADQTQDGEVSGQLNLLTGQAYEQSGDVAITTGNSTKGSGSFNSGSISLITGTVASAGSRGTILMDANRVQLQSLTPLNLAPSATDPGSAIAGDMYYNTTSNEIKYFNGTIWTSLSAAGSGANTALSNLAAVAINDSLVFGTGITGFIKTNDETGGTSSTTMLVQSGAVVDGNSAGVQINSGDAAGTGSTGTVSIFAGSAAGAGTGGDVSIGSGSSVSGPIGNIFILAPDGNGAGGGDLYIRAGTNGNVNQGSTNIGGKAIVFEAATRAGVWDGAYLKLGVTSGTPPGITVAVGDMHFDQSSGVMNYYSNAGGGEYVEVWPKKPIKETITLSSGDITNQYIDLAHIAHVDSIQFMVRGSNGPLWEGASYDYTVSYTGGAGGNTRITFLNDIATGGPSALVAGNILQICYLWNFQ